MGQEQSKTSTMGESYRQLSPNAKVLTVHFYGDSMKDNPLYILLDTAQTYEQVLIQCSEHLLEKLGCFFTRKCEKTLGPLLLPLFGLYAKDHSLQHWVADSQVFDQSNARQEFYFRIKVRLPVVASSTEKIPQGVFADYLFWQCAEDFLSGRVWQLFGADNKIKDIDSVNFNVLHIFMASAPYRLHDVVTCHPSRILTTPLKEITSLKFVKQKVKPWNMLRRFPESMSPELQREYNIKKDPLLRCISYCFLRKYITEFFGHNCKMSLRELRSKFVSILIRNYVLKYGLEFFAAEKLRSKDLRPVPVELIIRPFQDGCSPGLYFNKKLVARLQDILRVDVPESEISSSEQKCQISLEFRNQPPMTLQMTSRESAESFTSVLDIYYRLKVNYHSSLRDDPQRAPVLRVLNMLRSYGPMQEEDARKRLRDRKKADDRLSPDVPQYLIYQDCEKFGLLHLLSTVVGSDNVTGYDIGFRQAHGESGFHFTVYTDTSESNETQLETHDPKRLMIHLNGQSGQRIVPKEDELCGAMHLLKDESSVDPYYSDIAEVAAESRTKDVPTLYREDQVVIPPGSPMEQGRFSQVFHFTQRDQERMAVLKKVTSNDPEVQEAYRRGIERLMKLRASSYFFLRVYGLMVASPLRIIMESMPSDKGSLLRRLPSTSPPFTWLHFSSVLKQLASCLDHLAENKLIYGSFCCAKILILSETDDEEDQRLIIRLGDPSVAMYLDKLPLTDPQNQERLAWVAPERFDGLSQHTVASEVYALGTTLWEMAAHGRHPNTVIPSHPFLKDFFKANNRLPLDFLGVETAPEESDQLLGSIQPQDWTRQWVTTQDLEKQASMDTNQATANPQQASGDSQQATANPQQATANPQQASGDSQQASGDSQEAGDIPEYVTGAQCVNDSGQERPQGEAETSAGGDQEKTTPEQPNVRLQEVKKAICCLIRSCWDSDPNQRPSPTDIRKKSVSVSKLVMQATCEDPQWQQSIVLDQAVRIGIVNNPENAPRMKRELQERFRVDQAGQSKLMEEQERLERLKRLEMEVRNSMQCSIEASRLDFTNSKQLGKGNFGVVKTALLCEESETREEEARCRKDAVAVKTINEDHKPDEVSQFLKEALCIYKLEHRNVTKLIGIVMKGVNNPYQLVMEYADLGSLEKYVDSKKGCLGTLAFKKFLKSFTVDVAKGMEYVCQVVDRVHGDLAARNVLLFSVGGRDNKPPTAKLCDFGLSHQLHKGYYNLCKSSNKSPQLPAYLLPPESLKGWQDKEVKFTIYSDIWSYGIFLWEIFSNKRPENTLGNIPMAILERLMREKDPLPLPDNCPLKMYDIMRKCWEKEKEDRPKFDELLDMIEMLTDHDMD